MHFLLILIIFVETFSPEWEPSNNLLPSPTQKKKNEERIAKELGRRTKWNVKVSTFCLLAVPELQKLISNIRKCLTYKQCSALGCFGSFWPDNDQKMDPLPMANKLGPTRFKAKLLYYLLVLFTLFAVGLQALGPVMNLCSTSQLQVLFLHSLLLNDRYSVLTASDVPLTTYQ